MKVRAGFFSQNVFNQLAKKAVFFSLALAATLIGIIATPAQEEVTNPKRGFQPGASYSISDVENINTTNGNLMLNVPLAVLPPGRGGMRPSLSLMYNSKLYDTTVENTLDSSGQMALQNMLKRSEDGGWKYVTDNYSLDVISRYETYTPASCNIGQYAYKWKVFLHMPDGNKKEFRPAGFNDIYYDGFFAVTPGGFNTPACPDNPSLYSSSGMVYYSIDGSYTKLVVDYVAGGFTSGENNPWTLYMPDGSKVRGGTGLITRITDRNGNYIEGLTDIFNRSISIQTNAAPDEDHITMQGANNQQLVWKVKWKTFTFTRQYKTTNGGDGFGRGGTSTQTLSMQFRVVDKITLPMQLGNLFYEFHYNRESSVGWGELSSITLPSGAAAAYEYKWDTDIFAPLFPETGDVLENSAKKKTLSYLSEYDGGSSSVSEIWQYNIGQTQSTITAPDGNVTSEYHGDTSYENKMSGLVYKTSNSNGSITERIWDWKYPTGDYTTANINAYVKTEFVTVPDNDGTPSWTAIKDYTLDANGNQILVKEYDWVSYLSLQRDSYGKVIGIPAEAQLKRITATSYYNSVSENSSNAYWQASSPNIRNAVKSTEVQDGSGTPVSRSEFFYDDKITLTKGNLTETKSWDSTKGNHTNPLGANSISATAAYDLYGNPTLMTDAKGYQTQITYGSVNGYSDLYPTQTITAYGITAIQRTSTAAYDFSTGLVTTVTDVDNNVSSSTTYDALGRPTKAAAAVGTSLEVWTQSEYSDATRRVITRSDLEMKGDAKKVAVQFYDQLGRVRLTKTLEDAATQSATNETDGIKVQTRYRTSGDHTYQLTSNPYRANYSYNAGGEQSMGWTRTKAINTGKHSEVQTFSGASLPAPWGTNTNSTGVVQTDIDADRTLVTDQAGKQRISKTNALGQLTDMWEITAADASTVPVSFPYQALAAGYQTSYTYDPLNNLTQVNQGSQTRNFTYSSLSRLLSATNPEMGTFPTNGTISYQYDNNGNLIQKTDPRGIQTNYIYDALNRVTTRSYTDGATPQVTHTYDNLPNAKGRLTKVTNAFSTTEYTAFDVLGRVTSHKQTTDGTAYTTGYSYNLSGALNEETYPSGRVVKNVLDNDGDLSTVQSKKNQAAGFSDYAKNFTYTAAGAVSSMQLGNGRWESTQFNSRLQPVQIALGTAQNATNLLKLDYGYGGTDNNGNAQSQTITVPTVGQNPGFTAVQSYTYDGLNRLKLATENIDGNPTSSWKQTFLYDRYGNRNFDTANTTTLGSCSQAQCNPAVDVANNRFTSGQGYTYDLGGNVISDAQGRSFAYDAENKQKTISNTSGTIGQYFYDGDGKRVKKVAGMETTIFVYDAMGKLVAEYSNQTNSNPQVSYLTNDHLGSPRILTDANGNVFSRRDFHPFGEEVYTPQRVQGLGYTGDNVRQKFTGYERDNESNLDFAQARMYSYSHGRFTTTDPSHKSIHPTNPQTWNRYTYCYNNPLALVDKNGEWPTLTHDALIVNSFRGLTAAQISLIQTGSRNTDRISGGKLASTLWPSEAHKHAMTPDGMTSDQAHDKAWGYLKDKLAEVKSLQKGYEKLGGKGLSGSALVALGEATHVYEDMTSPVHGFDKEYKVPTITLLVPIPGAGLIPITVTDVQKWKQELDEHSAQESGEPMAEQRTQTALYSRAFFLIGFGEKEFKRLEMTNEERKAARELADRYRNQ